MQYIAACASMKVLEGLNFQEEELLKQHLSAEGTKTLACCIFISAIKITK